MKDLQPCPFCGSKAWFRSGSLDYGQAAAGCSALPGDCPVRPVIRRYMSDEYVVSIWNHRPTPTTTLNGQRGYVLKDPDYGVGTLAGIHRIITDNPIVSGSYGPDDYSQWGQNITDAWSNAVEQVRAQCWRSADAPPPVQLRGAPVSETVLCYCGTDNQQRPIYRWGYYNYEEQGWAISKLFGMRVYLWMYIPAVPEEVEV